MEAKQNMSDKEYMDDILITSKALSNLYHYAVLESPTDKVHYQFKDILNQSLEMQHQIFTVMQQKGWYPLDAAPAQDINKTKTTFQQG